MKKKYAYMWGGVMILSSILLSQGCTKSTASSSDLVGNWKKASDFDGNGRSEAVTFTIGDSVYLTTGTTDRDRFKDLWVFSLSRQYWSQRADLPGTARNSAVGFTINNKGYVGTGYDGSNKLNDFYEYNPSANVWLRKADFPGTGRYEASGFSVDNKGYITCGFDGNYLRDLYQYTPGSTAADPGTWVQKASMGGTKRSSAMVFILNNEVYICSGDNNGTSLNDLWMYEASSDTWTEKRKISNVSTDTYDDTYAIARTNGVAFIMGSYAYVTCGANGSLLSTTWRYDPSADLWIQKTGFEGSAREGAVAFTLNNRGFVLTGRSGSLSFDNMYEFEPDVAVNANDN